MESGFIIWLAFFFHLHAKLTAQPAAGQPSERDDTACSSAYVTGYAARLLGKEKRLSAQELRQRILADARSMAGGSKFLP